MYVHTYMACLIFVSTCFVRASRNCDLFTLDKTDLDICLRFDRNLSTKIFKVANMRHKTFQRNLKASSIMINEKRRMSSSAAAAAAAVAAASVMKSSVQMEDIELGIMSTNMVNSTTQVDENGDAEVPWFKHPLYFTISHQSYLIKALSVVSILFNIVLSIIIPFEV